ncbi:hypothetical protein SDC9_87247 [bioreactor metagenome]|uniref:PASTA domain-containing protein n=1 Tax=bioreactor metagenome TaxID=1076179 RepID=A0A644ZPJ1_9ZZZZ
MVSLGPEVKKATVPALVDQPLEIALSMLKSAGLIQGSVVEETSDKVAGIVIYQSHAAGTEVDEGTAVSLKVSKGGVPPTDTPASPDPSPSVEPVIYTKKITITLPADKESVKVRVEVDGEVKFNNVVYRTITVDGTIYPAVTGTGIHTVSVYFDDVLHESYPLDFTKPSE